MGWERRQRGSQYYYRHTRVGGKPRSLYLGKGVIGALAAYQDLQHRQMKLAAHTAKLALKAKLAELDRSWAATWKQVRNLASAILVQSGWYRHRGQWRKVMGKPRTRKPEYRPATPQEAANCNAWLEELTSKANSGDAQALAQLRAFLDENPAVWQTIGDLNRITQNHWISLLVGQNVLCRESVTRSINAWKNQLFGPDATPTEKILAETAAVARLALAHAEFLATEPGATVQIASFRTKRLDSALHRLNATLKLLAQVQTARENAPAPTSDPAVGMPRLYIPSRKRTKKAA